MNRLSSYTKDKVANGIAFMPLRKSSSIETGELFVKLADQLPEGSLGHLSEEPGYGPACHLLQVQTQPVLQRAAHTVEATRTLPPQKVPDLAEEQGGWIHGHSGLPSLLTKAVPRGQ